MNSRWFEVVFRDALCVKLVFGRVGLFGRRLTRDRYGRDLISRRGWLRGLPDLGRKKQI